MIIDFRIRPPFKEFLSMGPFDVKASGFDPQYPGQMYDYIPPPFGNNEGSICFYG